jgi:hypothetical protein
MFLVLNLENVPLQFHVGMMVACQTPRLGSTKIQGGTALDMSWMNGELFF